MNAAITRLAKRSAVMLSGEMVQSAFHFALNILMVRRLPPADYGVFAIVLLMGGLSLTYMRCFAGLPANLHIPQHAGTRRSLPYEVTFGTAAISFALVTAVIVMTTLELWLHADAVTGGLFAGFWVLRSYLRSANFAKGQQGLASISDLVFTLSGAAMTIFLFFITANGVSLQRVFAILAAANLLSILTTVILQRQKVRITVRASMRRRYLAILRQVAWSAVGTTTANVQAQGQVLLIAAISGPAAYAPIAAMLVMFAPLRLISSAIANMVQPEIAGLAVKGSNRAIAMLMWRWTAALAVLGVLYGFAMIFAVPLLGSAVFDGQPRELIGILAWGISISPLLYLMPRVVLEVERAFRAIAVITTAGAAIGMLLVAILLVTKSPAWSLLGSFVSEVIVLVCCWAAMRRSAASRQTDRGPGSLAEAEGT